MKNTIIPLSLVLFGLLIGIAVTEGFLRLYDFTKREYFVWTPYRQEVLTPKEGVMVGVSGEASFSINEEGMRSDLYSNHYSHKILAIGGSTTECLYLDQSKTWTQRVQNQLSKTLNTDVYVGNVGKSGHSSREHIFQTFHLLDQYKDVGTVMILAGINDMIKSISDVNFKYFDINNSQMRKEVYQKAFEVYPSLILNEEKSFFSQIYLWKFISDRIYPTSKQRKINKTKVVRQDNIGSWYADVRKYRQNATNLVNTIPEVSEALKEYKRNISIIIKEIKKRGVTPVLLTQPILWSKNFPQEYEKYIWIGGVGKGNFMAGEVSNYYTTDVLYEVIEKYNNIIRKICKSENISCIDLGRKLPKDLTVFYDDVHFNYTGAKQVAKIVSKELLKVLRSYTSNQVL